MLISELKKGDNVTIKIKPDKFLSGGEVDKDNKKVKFEKWEVVDEENGRIECTFWDKQNLERLNDNIGKWIMAYKFYVSEYESKLSLSSARYGYIKEIN
mgnify:CR=1